MPDFINRSVTLKLFVGFLAIGLVGMLLGTLVISTLISIELDIFVNKGLDEPDSFYNRVKTYYEEAGWDGVADQPGLDWTLTVDVSSAYIVDNDEYVHIPKGASLDEIVWWQSLVRIERDLIVDGEVIGKMIAVPLTLEFTNHVSRILAVVLIGTVLVSVALARFGAKRLTRPVRQLTVAANALAKGEKTTPILIRSGDELGQLGMAFNSMSEEVTEAREMRKQLTADIAHDIRTPLGLIVGHAEALRDGVLPGSPEVYDLLHDEALRINRMVHDLATLSKAESGVLHLQRSLISPRLLLDRAMATHLPLATNKGVQLEMDADDVGAAVAINVDKERMGQVLDNLLSNALRYTESGGLIQLSAKQVNDTVQLCVRDSGCGISRDQLSHIFDRFYRGDKSRSSNKGGSGLGLSIAKWIVQTHGGVISAESEVGKGSIFRITLPITTECMM